MPDAPKVFISHSNADKVRFVIPFATILRTNGLDAWVDAWEIRPGDSLIAKIFMEGLAKADTVVAVLSETSIKSKWVAEELDVAHTMRIQERTRLIPVLIDNITVPDNLKHLLWISLEKEGSIEATACRVIETVFNATARPEIGSPPVYAGDVLPEIGGLEPQDVLVLKLLCEHAVQKEELFVNTSAVLPALQENGLSQAQIEESLRILADEYYLKGDATLGFRIPPFFTITTSGFHEYLSIYDPTYNNNLRAICFDLVNNDRHSSAEVETTTATKRFMVHHILDVLEQKGYVSVTPVSGNIYLIGPINPKLARLLRSA